MANKYKSKFHCKENFRHYPYGSDPDSNPEIANINWQGVNPNVDTRNSLLPRCYPATAVLWKLDIQTGGSQWELNIGINEASVETSSITYRERGFSALKEPVLTYASGGRPLFYYDNKIFFGGTWAEATPSRAFFNFVSAVDGSTTHGTVEHMPTHPTYSGIRIFNDHTAVSGDYLIAGTTVGAWKIDLTDWETITISSGSYPAMTNGVCFDGTNIMCPQSSSTARTSSDFATWNTVTYSGSSFTCGVSEQFHNKTLSDPLAVPTYHASSGIGKYSLISASGTVTATTAATGTGGRIYRNGSQFVGVSGTTFEVYDSSLALLDTIDGSSFPTFTSFIAPRSPNVFPLGDGESWIISNSSGIHKFSLSSGVIWSNTTPTLSGVVSVSTTEGVVVVSGLFAASGKQTQIAYGFDLDTGDLIWNRTYPYRSKHLFNGSNSTHSYIQNLIVGSDVFLLVPNNTPAIRYG
ncbi:MAG: hypothetical protein H6824_01255 [Planctomycetaceae bacterium]|nr:hypothetical protein [Planctomycetaceae bacterium]